MIMKYMVGGLIAIVLIIGYFINKSNKEDMARLKQAEVVQKQRIQDEKQAEIAKKEAEAQEVLNKQRQAEESLKAEQNQQHAQMLVAENKVKETLLDPNSAQFRNQKGNCGEVNAKNRMGGYIGFSRYIYAPDSKVAFIESDAKDSIITPSIMDGLWAKNCS